MPMNFQPMRVTIRELFNGYVDNAEQGIIGYGGRLNIRPPYQREFIYDTDKQRKVIETVLAGYPLNALYWFKVAEDKWEVLDGQQRILSICNFLTGKVPLYDARTVGGFKDSNPELYEALLEYELMVYECGGTQQDRLAWFRAVNIPGTVLTEQEMRNAVYSGPWIADARKRFGKSNCAGYRLLKDIMNINREDVARQGLLEIIIAWHADKEFPKLKQRRIEQYMGKHQMDENAERLYQYAQEVVGWVIKQFPESVRNYKVFYRVPWGLLYNRYADKSFTPSEVESKLMALFDDDEVTNTAGIFSYIFSGNTSDLSIRAFPDSIRVQRYNLQGGICPMCRNEGNHRVWKLNEMDADHIIPWSEGGKTVLENCQMLCHKHNLNKSAKTFNSDITTDEPEDSDVSGMSHF